MFDEDDSDAGKLGFQRQDGNYRVHSRHQGEAGTVFRAGEVQRRATETREDGRSQFRSQENHG